MQSRFISGEYTQTEKEQRCDFKRMKTLKRNIEKHFPQSSLDIEDPIEWVHVWRIPFVLNSSEIREVHFKVIRGFGGNLCVVETYSGETNNDYVVEFKKSKHFWRAWNIADMFLLFSTILGIGFCIYTIYCKLHRDGFLEGTIE